MLSVKKQKSDLQGSAQLQHTKYDGYNFPGYQKMLEFGLSCKWPWLPLEQISAAGLVPLGDTRGKMLNLIFKSHIDGVLQERCNFFANVLELCFLALTHSNTIADSCEPHYVWLNVTSFVALGDYWLIVL